MDSFIGYCIFIIICCILGILFGFYNWLAVFNVTTGRGKDLTSVGDQENLVEDSHLKTMNLTSEKIQKGAITFLSYEYFYLSIFVLLFALLLIFIDGFSFYTSIAFILGAATSVLSGFIGMYVATRTNVRVTFMAYHYGCLKQKEDAYKNAFNVAFKGGCVMGFILVSLALLILTLIIMIYKSILGPNLDYLKMFEYISGYGLGGSTVALFCRVGGGIYTKAADVGADLVGKNELNLPEDSPENPATIADNVGDNVGDIAGMGSDLFGSFAESTCAALVISGTCPDLLKNDIYLFPLMLSAFGIIACILTSFFATNIMVVTTAPQIERTLQFQLIISTVILTPVIICLSYFILPKELNGLSADGIVVYNFNIMISILCGLYAGLLIGFITDYYTSKKHGPTIELAQACKSGAAINIIHGLSLGYLSCIIPILAICLCLFISYYYSGLYGIAMAALGMLSNLSISLAIDAYGPISDNAGGIAEMSELPAHVRETTDDLDAAGNTTAAVGKGFAIGSACLVSLALFGAFVTRTKIKKIDLYLLDPLIMTCLLLGAMIPYAFSAMTMKSVGNAAQKMCNQIKNQIMNNEGNSPEPCIIIATQESLREMILPGILVIFTPIAIGYILGCKAVCGYLAGVIVSGVQMAISSSNSGGAWDNAKKYIEGGNLIITQEDKTFFKKDEKVKNLISTSMDMENVPFPKGSGPHQAAVVGDTVGDPLKDTSGPSLNILIKLSAIVSLVFGSFFANYSVWNRIPSS